MRFDRLYWWKIMWFPLNSESSAIPSVTERLHVFKVKHAVQYNTYVLHGKNRHTLSKQASTIVTNRLRLIAAWKMDVSFRNKRSMRDRSFIFILSVRKSLIWRIVQRKNLSFYCQISILSQFVTNNLICKNIIFPMRKLTTLTFS